MPNVVRVCSGRSWSWCISWRKDILSDIQSQDIFLYISQCFDTQSKKYIFAPVTYNGQGFGLHLIKAAGRMSCGTREDG